MRLSDELPTIASLELVLLIRLTVPKTAVFSRKTEGRSLRSPSVQVACNETSWTSRGNSEVIRPESDGYDRTFAPEVLMRPTTHLCEACRRKHDAPLWYYDVDSLGPLSSQSWLCCAKFNLLSERNQLQWRLAVWDPPQESHSSTTVNSKV